MPSCIASTLASGIAMLLARLTRSDSPTRWLLRFLGYSVAVTGVVGFILWAFEDEPLSLSLMKLSSIPLFLLASEMVKTRTPVTDSGHRNRGRFLHYAAEGFVYALWIQIVIWSPDQRPERMILSLLATCAAWPLMMSVFDALGGVRQDTKPD